MESLAYTFGSLCLAWTGLEVARLLIRGGPRPTASFGAVDLDGGRPLDVVLDRRTRGRRDEDEPSYSPSLAL